MASDQRCLNYTVGKDCTFLPHLWLPRGNWLAIVENICLFGMLHAYEASNRCFFSKKNWSGYNKHIINNAVHTHSHVIIFLNQIIKIILMILWCF